MVSRRRFLKGAAAVAAGFGGLQQVACLSLREQQAAAALPEIKNGYGPLVPDPEGLLDLPRGFSYRVLSRTGDAMDDGLLVPGGPDGMATFVGPKGRTLLVRNHELTPGNPAVGPFGEGNALLDQYPAAQIYDLGGGKTPCLGGTSTVVYDTRTGKVERQYLSLAGTVRNCAGGPTPWDSWITCEESTLRASGDLEQDHGYNFEVPASHQVRRAAATPLKAMGRFNHEAVAVDPRTGIVYQTEDTGDSLIYRYLPHQKGDLAAGGRLQALVVRSAPGLDTRNWEEVLVPPGQALEVGWIDIENVESPDNDLRHQGHAKGAAVFARGEGMWYGRDSVYFACTNGGAARKGQIWRYWPSPAEGTAAEAERPGRLELFIEPNDGTLVDNADNLTVAPWGDLVVCEDGPEAQFLVGVTPQGSLYKLGHNAFNHSEFAGATFSPDGKVLFVNIQWPGITLGITGPWRRG